MCQELGCHCCCPPADQRTRGHVTENSLYLACTWRWLQLLMCQELGCHCCCLPADQRTEGHVTDKLPTWPVLEDDSSCWCVRSGTAIVVAPQLIRGHEVTWQDRLSILLRRPLFTQNDKQKDTCRTIQKVFLNPRWIWQDVHPYPDGLKIEISWQGIYSFTCQPNIHIIAGGGRMEGGMRVGMQVNEPFFPDKTSQP